MSKKQPPGPDQVARAQQADQVRKLKTQAKHQQQRIRELDRLVERQSEELGRKRDRVFSVSPSRNPARGEFCRIVLPDLHGYAMHRPAVEAALADIKSLEPREIVLLGDLVDCGGFLAQHHTMCYVAETDYSFRDDVAAANGFLDSLQTVAPNATLHYIEGNHERRVERWIVTQTLRNKKDAEYLRQLFAIPTQLSTDQRGIHYYVENQHHMGLPVRGAIRLGHCHFTHGSTAAKHAASAMVDKFSSCVVFGHTHRADSFTRRTVHSGVISAWNPGCLCDLQPMWRHTDPTNWSHGYALQICRKDGTFLHINVPILEGKSYMRSLTKRL